MSEVLIMNLERRGEAEEKGGTVRVLVMIFFLKKLI